MASAEDGSHPHPVARVHTAYLCATRLRLREAKAATALSCNGQCHQDDRHEERRGACAQANGWQTAGGGAWPVPSGCSTSLRCRGITVLSWTELARRSPSNHTSGSRNRSCYRYAAPTQQRHSLEAPLGNRTVLRANRIQTPIQLPRTRSGWKTHGRFSGKEGDSATDSRGGSTALVDPIALLLRAAVGRRVQFCERDRCTEATRPHCASAGARSNAIPLGSGTMTGLWQACGFRTNSFSIMDEIYPILPKRSPGWLHASQS